MEFTHIDAVSSMLKENYSAANTESLSIQLQEVASTLTKEYWNVLDKQTISQEDAAVRIRDLLVEGTLATNVELAEADGLVRTELAKSLLFLKNDLSDATKEQGYLSCLEPLPSGYPAAIPALTEMLTDSTFTDELRGEFAQLYAVYSEDRGLLRFHYHKLADLWNTLKSMKAERKEYTSSLADFPEIDVSVQQGVTL